MVLRDRRARGHGSDETHHDAEDREKKPEPTPLALEDEIPLELAESTGTAKIVLREPNETKIIKASDYSWI